ncbi:MAG TPA: hypothetical protein VLA29_02600 [Acidimicrobiia bacterium]|nr:hypothetical protein [Acidimicrobiia bacterium]
MTPPGPLPVRAVTPPAANVARRMSPPMGYVALRWWWSKWHRFVRLGWSITRENASGTAARTYFGLGLIGTGLLLGRRRTRRVYQTIVPSGDEIRIRVVPAGDRRR